VVGSHREDAEKDQIAAGPKPDWTKITLWPEGRRLLCSERCKNLGMGDMHLGRGGALAELEQ